MLNTKENIHTLTEISLAKYKIWSIEGDRRSDVIRCVSGILWITQEGDQKDYVIEAGRNFWVTKTGTVIVQALDSSKFKYSLNEMQDHIEINPQPIHHTHQSRVSRLFR
jgi:hypothetical protein